MNKKGFTLIELLAVIIILAILMVIAVPSVLSTLNEAKKNAFKTEIQSIMKASEQQYIIDSMQGGSGASCYDTSNLDLSSLSSDTFFKVNMDSTGKVASVEAVKLTEKLKGTATTIDGVSITVEEDLEECGCGTSTGGSAYTDGTIASAPVLGDLIPIKYNGTNWVYADTSEEWYDYANKEWANAVVLSSGVTKNVKDTISEDEIDLWFVWVPRYEYKLPSASIGTTGTPNAIDINFISSSVTSATSGYSLHPGFKFGDTWKSGLWIGKFESTSDAPTTDSVQTIKIKANTASWTNVQPANMYTSSLNVDTLYNLSGMDSHMTRYTEWTTMSYLSNSIYGRCSSSTSCTEITMNSSGSYLTGGGAYKTNTAQSSTGNVTGIYDISGGAGEYVMGYLSGASYLYKYSGFTSSTIPTDYKYTDIFTSSNSNTYNYSVLTGINGSTSMNGVFSELLSTKTNTTSWYGDRAYSVSSTYLWFGLGGYFGDGTYAGAFASACNDGDAYSFIGFRVVLCAD